MKHGLAVARDANDPLRCALALEQIGRVYLHQKQYTDAREIFTVGTLTAERAHSGEAEAMLLSGQARTYAETKQPLRALDCMTRAEEALTQPTETTLPEPRTFNQARLTSDYGRLYATLTSHDTRFVDQAITTLTASTTPSNTLHVKRLVFRLTELAAAHLYGGDRETGIHIGHQVMDMAAHMRSERLAEHLKILRAAVHVQVAGSDITELATRL
ncbi:hypothetical protein [Actinokineospora enzanensis]|uniref:hypothetical protein n=1 Tax=Actinokineospora enzanensis TaxID=155975 RepID=UPI000382CFF1|nr:hypothetical protein [Actinokineospora enzanensis]